MFTEMLSWLKSALKRKASSQSKSRPSVRLYLEQLEEREVLNNYTWQGAAAGLWSFAGNWFDTDTQANAVAAPNANDNLTFNNRSVNNSRADIAEVKSLTVNANYTGTISIKAVGATGELKIGLALTIQGGTIQGDPDKLVNLLNFTGANTSFTWGGGTIKKLQIDLGDATNNLTTNTTINGNVTIETGTYIYNNKGTITWASGNITVAQNALAGITNKAGGTFDIRSDATMSGPAQGVNFINEGGLTKSQGNATTTVDVAFENKSTVTLVTGTLKFGKTATQSSGSTALSGGQLEATNGYSVGSGSLTGTGTITGNLTISGDALLRPGQGGAPGNIIVKGNYTQTGGTLQIDISAQGVISTLSVQAVGGQGGVATLGGTLAINRDEGYTPDEIGLALTFMTYASVSGDFTAINYLTPNSWTNGVPPGFAPGGGGQFRFAPLKNSTNYQLVVEADD